jgi:ADP-ribose pyrophosphatase
MKIKKWKILNEIDISPSPWFPLFKQKVQIHDGTMINDFYVSRLGGVGMVIPVTSNKEIVMVRQYKHGIEEVTLELPAGRMKKGRNAKETACYELEEETGILTHDLIFLGRVSPVPSKDSTIVYGYLAKDVKITQKQKLDTTENIEIVIVPARDVLKKIKNGEVIQSDTISILTLAYLKYPYIFK